jgi:hypothetical protein
MSENSEGVDVNWPNVLWIPQGDEFRQSFAVAQLAVKLCELKKANSRAPLEKENADPKGFLNEAWELIEGARKCVLRPMTDLEYLTASDGKQEVLERVLQRRSRESVIPFQRLCDRERNKGDTETINGIEWKVYRSERGFDELFWKYWSDIGDRWKRGDQKIGTVLQSDTRRKSRRVNFHSKSERKELAKVARDADAWKELGKEVLSAWKQDAVPPADFSALAEFRREHDKRAANLKKPKRSRVVKGRTQQRNRSGA